MYDMFIDLWLMLCIKEESVTKFLNHTRIKTVVGENGNIGKWENLGRITYYPY